MMFTKDGGGGSKTYLGKFTIEIEFYMGGRPTEPPPPKKTLLDLRITGIHA